jgi:hypothetical protein
MSDDITHNLTVVREALEAEGLGVHVKLIDAAIEGVAGLRASVPADWPVKENLKHEIVLMPNARDIKTAKKQDPRACALHNAACRMFDIPNCAIGGRWAYIPQRDKTGKHYIARMQAPIETRKAIQHFDKTGEMPEGGFRFVPIAPSHRYKAKNSYNKSVRTGDHIPTSGKKRKISKKRLPPMRAIPRTFAA